MADEVEHMVTALLAVGGYSLQRAWDCLDALREEGLLESEVVLGLEAGEVVKRLARAGYDRGPTVTTSMANRLVDLHEKARAGELVRAATLLRKGKAAEAEKLACRIKGVGPIVFRHFAALQKG